MKVPLLGAFSTMGKSGRMFSEGPRRRTRVTVPVVVGWVEC